MKPHEMVEIALSPDKPRSHAVGPVVTPKIIRAMWRTDEGAQLKLVRWRAGGEVHLYSWLQLRKVDVKFYHVLLKQSDVIVDLLEQSEGNECEVDDVMMRDYASQVNFDLA